MGRWTGPDGTEAGPNRERGGILRRHTPLGDVTWSATRVANDTTGLDDLGADSTYSRELRLDFMLKVEDMSIRILFETWDLPRRPRPGRYTEPGWPLGADQSNTVFLLANLGWDDFGFKTNFLVHVFDGHEWVHIGDTGIGYAGQERGRTYDWLGQPGELRELPDSCYSLGQDLDYYESLINRLGLDNATAVLRALRDVCVDDDARARAKGERALDKSLTRSNAAFEAMEAAGRFFGRSPAGDETVDSFKAAVYLDGADGPHEFRFDFRQTEPAASRINVLVGINGTGKTQSMAHLARLFSRVLRSDNRVQHEGPDQLDPRPSIYSVITVSYSAFDYFVKPTADVAGRFNYVYCGLEDLGTSGNGLSHAVSDRLQRKFSSLDSEGRYRALEPLLPSLVDTFDVDAACAQGRIDDAPLSAGQRIVLVSTCELVRGVRNRSMVLIDEPETHLHPQLLSSLVAWLNDLLSERDSFAIVATHSPSVVQQVRRDAVHVLRRDGAIPIVTKPSIETFGANLTEIVHEVFEDREGDRSYQDTLQSLFDAYGSADRVNELFDDQLRLNALVFLRSLELK